MKLTRNRNLACGVDIGSSKVAVCLMASEEGVHNVLGFGQTPCQGLRRGVVVDVEETVSALSQAVEEVERMAGISLEAGYLAVNGAHIDSATSRGVIAVSRADGEITDADVARCLEAAKAVSLPPNREILHVIPKTFIIDGQDSIKDPVGMSGVRLEVDAHVIGVSTSAIKNLSKCVFQAGLDIQNFAFGPLAAARLLLSKKQRELGVLLLDIGAGTTAMAVFEEGDAVSSAVFPIGSAHITNDIAIGLRTSLDVAERVKIEEGTALPESVGEDEVVPLAKYGGEQGEEASRRYVSEIIEARVSEIISMVKEALREIGREGTLPAGVVLTGGGAKLPGLVDKVKSELRLPAQVGMPTMELATQIGGMVDRLDDPRSTVAVGLAFLSTEEGARQPLLAFPRLTSISNMVKQWMKQFLP